MAIHSTVRMLMYLNGRLVCEIGRCLVVSDPKWEIFCNAGTIASGDCHPQQISAHGGEFSKQSPSPREKALSILLLEERLATVNCVKPCAPQSDLQPFVRVILHLYAAELKWECFL